jgi:hypothetical protein
VDGFGFEAIDAPAAGAVLVVDCEDSFQTNGTLGAASETFPYTPERSATDSDVWRKS